MKFELERKLVLTLNLSEKREHSLDHVLDTSIAVELGHASCF